MKHDVYMCRRLIIRKRGCYVAMKATGIVRRIDDLGRVVIPKEIRRTLRIREGDPLEIFVDREGEVILKKYSPINELGHFATEYAESLYDSLQFPILICDRDEIIALSGISKKEYLHKNIGNEIEHTMEERTTKIQFESSVIEMVEGQAENMDAYCMSPIIANGDPVGCVVAFSIDTGKMSDVEERVIDTAARFLAKQME